MMSFTSKFIFNKADFGLSLCLFALSPQTFAHIIYYDLNQGKYLSDLTPAGQTLSTQQYGDNPVYNQLGANITNISDRPLNDPSQWQDGIYQINAGAPAGTFNNVTFTSDTSTASVDVNDAVDYGWADGTWGTLIHTSPWGTGLLGDSHKIIFFNFRLAKTSKVTITWNIDNRTGLYYDNGFSLYRGVMNYQAHDDLVTEPMNPQDPDNNYANIQDTLDMGNVYDAQGIASTFRDTVSNDQTPYLGQFNAFDNWGDSNANGNWSNISFIAAANSHNPTSGHSNNPADTLETLTIQLEPGNYTIAAAGALGARLANGSKAAASHNQTTLHGKLTFNAISIAVCP